MAKISKSEAHYRDHPNGAQKCVQCTMFDGPQRCTLVQGVIFYNGWCREFERKSRTAKWEGRGEK